jgi:hypothetical protein
MIPRESPPVLAPREAVILAVDDRHANLIALERALAGIPARIVLDLPAEGIAPLIEGGRFFIASVHPAIRWPDGAPPARGGHLVLVFGQMPTGELRFHNPSGDTPASRTDARLPAAAFGRFFAGRGILVG